MVVVVVVQWQQRKKESDDGSCMAVGSSLASTNKCQKPCYSVRCLLWMPPSFSHGKPFLSLSLSTHFKDFLVLLSSTAKTKVKSCNFFIILHFLRNKNPLSFSSCPFYLPVFNKFCHFGSPYLRMVSKILKNVLRYHLI